MSALRDRFRSLDAAPPPDLWAESLGRAAAPRTDGLPVGGSEWWLSRVAPAVLGATVIVASVAIGLAALRGSDVGDSPLPLAPTQAPSSTDVDPELGPDPVSPPRTAVVNRHVSAINAKSAEAFIAVFVPEGVFTPGADFDGATSLFANSLAVADTRGVEAWMAINRAWGFEAEVIRCNQDPSASMVYGYGEGAGEPMVVRCEVATRWHRLGLEITQRWSYEFHGDRLGHWAFGLLDLDPAERALPLGYEGLLRWEELLRATDPEAAARYLTTRADGPPCMECLDFANSLASDDPVRAAQLAPLISVSAADWTIGGRRFAPHGLIPYNPALADEIEASVKAYLADLEP